ncbi:VOC family protein [soil metagenome]|jgi:predicted lactoylglutathione lyase
MTKEFWLNLPVKDIKRTKDFFTKMDFKFNPNYGNSDTSACLMMGSKNVIVMFFEEPFFKSCTSNDIADTRQVTEVLLSIDAESPQEVDEIAKKATAAGGTIFSEPRDNQGWMYGCGFSDPDGHRWNVLHMDMSKMPKG